MALKKIVEVEGNSFVQSEFGIVNNGTTKMSINALCKINFLQGNKDSVEFFVSFIDDGVKFTKQYTFQPSVSDGSPNFIKQAYLYLKTLPEFYGAIDC